MIPPRRSIPLDYEVDEEVEARRREWTGDWPEFAPDRGPPAIGLAVLFTGAFVVAVGLGWLILRVLQ